MQSKQTNCKPSWKQKMRIFMTIIFQYYSSKVLFGYTFFFHIYIYIYIFNVNLIFLHSNCSLQTSQLMYYFVQSDRQPTNVANVLTLYPWALAVWLGFWQLSVKIHLKAPRQARLLATMLTRQKFVLSCLPESLMAWKKLSVWLVNFAGRTGDKLATFTTVNFIAN